MVGKGMNSFDNKQKRSQRRRNHVAKDLRSPFFRQKKVALKNKRDPSIDVSNDEYTIEDYWLDNPIDDFGEEIE